MQELEKVDYCLPELALGRPRITQRLCLCLQPINPVINLVCLLGSGRLADLSELTLIQSSSLMQKKQMYTCNLSIFPHVIRSLNPIPGLYQLGH